MTPVILSKVFQKNKREFMNKNIFSYVVAVQLLCVGQSFTGSFPSACPMANLTIRQKIEQCVHERDYLGIKNALIDEQRACAKLGEKKHTPLLLVFFSVVKYWNTEDIFLETILELLLKNTLSVNDCDDAGMTALHKAVNLRKDGNYRDNPQIVARLIKAGAYINATTQAGLSPLHFAAKNKCEAISNLLLKAKARISQNDLNMGIKSME